MSSRRRDPDMEVMSPVLDWTVRFGAKPLYGGGLAPGGVDLLTPSLTLHPGALRDTQNFEINQNGGYSRIGGYERYNGLPMPSAASFTFVQVSSFVTVPGVDATVAQASSGASGTVALVNNVVGACYMVLTDTTGSFDTTGVITSTPTTFQITAATPFQITAASSPWVFPTSLIATIGTAIEPTVVITGLLSAQFKAAAADIYRDRIDPVPGSGPLLGVLKMIIAGEDAVFGFRANEADNAVGIWRDSAAGWVSVPFKSIVHFTNGDLETPVDGETLIQGPATATIRRVVQQSGTELWAGNAAGAFVIDNPAMGFGPGAATTSGGATVVLTGPQVPISMAPGGKFRFRKYNFSGQLATKRAYGWDGVNPAFEFDGTTVVPIETGITPNVPSQLACHKEFLFLAYGSSVQRSADGLPFRYSSIDGAGEIATGDTITNMRTLPGAQDTAALGIWGLNQTGVLYGVDVASFNFVVFEAGAGSLPNAVQNLADAMSFPALGVVTLKASLNFGNFVSSGLTSAIQPFIDEKRTKIVCSSVQRSKGQYRVFFEDGYALWITMRDSQYLGPMFELFPNPVNCIDNDNNVLGTEVTYFGSSDALGYVYQMDVGPSFDGEDLFGYMVGAWDYIKMSPRILKKFRRASLELAGSSYAAVDFTFALANNSPDVGQPNSVSYSSSFSSATWDAMTWDEFIWDGQTVAPTYIKLGGNGQNIQPTIGSATNYIDPYSVNSIIYDYSNLRQLRGR